MKVQHPGSFTLSDYCDIHHYVMLCNLKKVAYLNFLLKAIRNESFEQEFDFVTNFYGGNLNTANLRT